MTNNLEITKETNADGFYLFADGSASAYNKSGYTTKDIHYLNMEAKEANQQ